MSRLVTYSHPFGIQGHRNPDLHKPLIHEVLLAELHEGPGDCSPQCAADYGKVWSHPIQFPHVDTAGAARVALFTPLCDPNGMWIDAEWSDYFGTDDAPGFMFDEVRQDRAEMIRHHRRRCSVPHLP